MELSEQNCTQQQCEVDLARDLCCMDFCLPFTAPPKHQNESENIRICVIQRSVTIIVACVSKRINIATTAASQQKKAQLNDKQFTSHFLVS